jgi:N2-acetyl-L-2,4-diaminobutanoate deacetylase
LSAAVSRPRNPITASVPFDEDGVHHGHLRLPYSRNDSAWGSVIIPITVIRNGEGPTALLTGANHGDEYEGPVALQALTSELDPKQVTGRVIIVPFMNVPAFRAATRTSPLDGANLNRIFPGKADGTPTEKIADYFDAVLAPMADYVLDFHSGGKTLDFVPFAAAHRLEAKMQEEACIAAMQAFNAPYSMVLLEIDNVGMFDTAVEGHGKVFVSTELGGGGTATAKSIGIARKGVRNFLIHAGILAATPEVAPSVELDMPDGDCFVFAEDDGMIEPLVDLGADVEAGAQIARIWPTARTGSPPIACHAKRGGLLVGRHFPGLVKSGDCLGVVAVRVGQHTPRFA